MFPQSVGHDSANSGEEHIPSPHVSLSAVERQSATDVKTHPIIRKMLGFMFDMTTEPSGIR